MMVIAYHWYVQGFSDRFLTHLIVSDVKTYRLTCVIRKPVSIVRCGIPYVTVATITLTMVHSFGYFKNKKNWQNIYFQNHFRAIELAVNESRKNHRRFYSKIFNLSNSNLCQSFIHHFNYVKVFTVTVFTRIHACPRS